MSPSIYYPTDVQFYCAVSYNTTLILLWILHVCLQLLLEGKSAMENAKLLKTTTNGATALLMACRHGHYDIAVYLIKRHKVNIEQTGSGNNN